MYKTAEARLLSLCVSALEENTADTSLDITWNSLNRLGLIKPKASKNLSIDFLFALDFKSTDAVQFSIDVACEPVNTIPVEVGPKLQ